MVATGSLRMASDWSPWDEPTERARRAVDAFHKAHPRAAEPVFVTAQSLAAGLPELPEPTPG
jgi:hypothetical protein